MKMKTHQFAALALLFAGTGIVKSQTTTWGTSQIPNPGNYLSSGNVSAPVLTWTIGWFNDGFTPTAANYADWEANYNPVGSTVDMLTFIGYGVINTIPDVGEAAYGKQAYVFAYNSLGLIGQNGGEALLYTESDYLFPEVLYSGTFDVDDMEGALNTADDAFEVVWGSVDRDIFNLGGVITGGGIINNPFPDATNIQWETQTATWPIPEPSTALLGVLGSLTLFRRKRASVAA